MRQPLRIAIITLMLGAAYVAFAGYGAAYGAEDWEKDLLYEVKIKVSMLVRGLDAPPYMRQKQIDELVSIGSGKNRELVFNQLTRALTFTNPQIREGAVEVMARIGDKRCLPILAETIIYDPFFDVRISILKHLPVFTVQDSPKLRQEVLEISERENFSLTKRICAILRRPPLRSSNNEFDPDQDHLQQSVARTVTTQLDPIGSAIEGLGSTKHEVKARQVLQRFCQISLGRNKEEWSEAWKARGLSFVSPLQNKITSVQVTACNILANIGAEGTEEMVFLLKRLTNTNSTRASAAALRCIAELCSLTHKETRTHNRILKRIMHDPEKEAEVAWRERRLTGGKRLIQLGTEAGLAKIPSSNEDVRRSAYDCLGTVGDPSTIEPIRRRLVQGEESITMQVHIASALGKIGYIDSLKILTVLAEKRSVGSGTKSERDEYRLVYAAINAIGEIAGSFGPGSQSALGELFRYLRNNRRLAGGPRKQDGEPTRIQDIALFQLQKICNIGATELDSTIWRRRYMEVRRKRELGLEAPEE